MFRILMHSKEITVNREIYVWDFFSLQSGILQIWGFPEQLHNKEQFYIEKNYNE